MLFNVRRFGFSSWVVTLVALALGLGGVATAFTVEGFHWPVVVVALVILGSQQLAMRCARVNTGARARA